MTTDHTQGAAETTWLILACSTCGLEVSGIRRQWRWCRRCETHRWFEVSEDESMTPTQTQGTTETARDAIADGISACRHPERPADYADRWIADNVLAALESAGFRLARADAPAAQTATMPYDEMSGYDQLNYRILRQFGMDHDAALDMANQWMRMRDAALGSGRGAGGWVTIPDVIDGYMITTELVEGKIVPHSLEIAGQTITFRAYLNATAAPSRTPDPTGAGTEGEEGE